MLQKISEFVNRHHMLAQQDKIIAGISGGADSVCLLFVLKSLQREYGLTLRAVHVNHGLRGSEADEDAAFTKDLCRRLDVPCTVYNYPVDRLAAAWGCSLEEAGRRTRYAAFARKIAEENRSETDRRREEEAKKAALEKHSLEPAASGGTDVWKVAVAHHMDDNAETMLFNLFRGTGLKGLGGIRPVGTLPHFGADCAVTAEKEGQCRDESASLAVPLIRPLLCVTRGEIEDFLDGEGLPFRNDSTNGEDGYTRNKIRRHVLSYVKEELFGTAVENMSRTADRLAQIEAYMEKTAGQAVEEGLLRDGDGVSVLLSAFRLQDPAVQSYMARDCIKRCGCGLKDVTDRHIRDICRLVDGQAGKYLCLPGGLRVRNMGDRLTFCREQRCAEGADGGGSQREKNGRTEIAVTVPGRYVLEETEEILEFTKKSYKKKQKIPNSAYTKWFDYDKIKSPLKIRTRNPGDYLTVTAEGGRKKLKDYLIDIKQPREARDGLLLLAEGSHVLWVLGLRISEAYKVTEETTDVLEVTISKERRTKDE